MSDQTIPTTCPLDCPDACALEVTVRDGRVAAIDGRRDHPDTAGFICAKVRRFGRRVEHEDRLLRPLRRTGPKGQGTFRSIGWDDALAEITERFRTIRAEWGGEAIVPYHYGGSNGLLTDGFLDDLYFARLGASRLARTLCAAPATAVAEGMYGKMPGVAFQDYVHAEVIVVWGANPKASNIHLMPYLREARRRGAFVAVVDPTRNLTTREADLHLPVYPGADLPLALAVIRRWRDTNRLDRAFLDAHALDVEVLLRAAEAWPVERAAREARVAPEAICELADRYAAGDPAVIRVGWGMERNRNGGQAMAAVLAMPALLGKFGVRGGGYTLSNSGAARFDQTTLLGDLRWRTRELNMSRLGDLLGGGVDPPIKGLFIYNCNPAVTVPDQNAVLRGLTRDDLFTVVFDQVMTDTAAYADLVLPATTFLEHRDVRVGYGAYVVGGVRPSVAPRGEARSNPEVFAALGRAMGFDDEAFRWDPASYVDGVAEAIDLNGGDADPSALLEGRLLRPGYPEGAPVPFVHVHPRTPDGKIHLAPRTLGDEPFAYDPVHDPAHPLALISPATSKLISSTLGEFNLPALYVELHPDDAADRGIADGDRVRVYNPLGEVVCPARITERMRPGVAAIPKGAWRRASLNGSTATALCPSHVGVVGGGACFNDARVEVTSASA